MNTGQRFVPVRVLAGLDLREPVDPQAKTKHDSTALDATSAGGETVSTLQQIQSGPAQRRQKLLDRKKNKCLITHFKEISECKSVQMSSFSNLLDYLPSSHINARQHKGSASPYIMPFIDCRDEIGGFEKQAAQKRYLRAGYPAIVAMLPQKPFPLQSKCSVLLAEAEPRHDVPNTCEGRCFQITQRVGKQRHTC